MNIIKKLYRKEYNGEDVNIVATYSDNHWKYQQEFVSESFDNLPMSNRAIVIGNGISRVDFDLRNILEHRDTAAWGERTPWRSPRIKKKFNTYGCNALYRDYKVDFLVATGEQIIQEIANDPYCVDNVVYANKNIVIDYPSKFHFIPQDLDYNSGSIATYMAAFDGHKKVYMLGFDGVDNNTNNYNYYANTPGYLPANHPTNEEYWTKCLYNIMTTYDDVEFIRVAPSSRFRTPERLKYVLNFRTIDFRQFVLEADL